MVVHELALAGHDVLNHPVAGRWARLGLVTVFEQRGITVLVKGVQPRHRKLMTTVGMLDELRHENHLFNTLDDAVAHARCHVQRAAQAIDVSQLDGRRQQNSRPHPR